MVITMVQTLQTFCSVLSREGGAAGRVYILDATQLQSLDEADRDGDRIVEIDDLVAPNRTLRISNPHDRLFGLSVNSLTDFSGDDSNDLMVWGSRSNHFVFSNAGIRLYDLNDLSADGFIELPDNAEEEFGTWRINVFSLDRGPAISTVLQSETENSLDLLVTPRFGSLFTAELDDLDYLDDPNGRRFERYRQHTSSASVIPASINYACLTVQKVDHH